MKPSESELGSACERRFGDIDIGGVLLSLFSLREPGRELVSMACSSIVVEEEVLGSDEIRLGSWVADKLESPPSDRLARLNIAVNVDIVE